MQNRQAVDQFVTPSSPLRVRTKVESVAVEFLARSFAPPHEVLLRESAAEFNCRLDLVPPGQLILGCVGFGTDVEIRVAGRGDFYHFNLPIVGSNYTVQYESCGWSAVERTGVALDPSGPYVVRWEPDSMHYALEVHKDVLERHAAKLLGHRISHRLGFDLTFDLSTAQSQALMSTVRFLHAELMKADGLHTISAARQEIESAVMTELLMAIPGEATRRLHDTEGGRRPKVMDAIAYIDDNPAEDFDLARLATIAGISVRALQIGFREVTGVSPSAYARSVRMHRVRLELMSGRARSVTEAATRWGFFHLSRFAEQYREQFGDLPSETMRKVEQKHGPTSELPGRALPPRAGRIDD